MSRYAKILVVVLAVVEIATCSFLMSLNPTWNGENPRHRNQYELIADSFIDGKLYFEYDDVDPMLAEMDNPYSPEERKRLGVSFHWDHAYYDGTYYMYFGAVPAVTLFVPFKLLTGQSLTTYHATQLYVALIIVAFYCLFFMFRSRLFPKVPPWLCALASFVLSFMSVWFAVARPALYCTAITAGVCFMIWSLYFFARAFLFEERTRRIIALTAAGAVCGALVFGCRPILGMANFLVVIPLLVWFLRKRVLPPWAKGALHADINAPHAAEILHTSNSAPIASSNPASVDFSPRAITALFAAGLTPFILVGAVLMAYNAARFGSPFEFGQSYQLTVSDQHLYGSQWFSVSGVLEQFPNWIQALFGFGGFSSSFPFVQFSGIFVNFPILLAPLLLFHPRCRKFLRANSGLVPLVCGAVLTALITVALDLAWSPTYLERYNLDVYYLLGICSFIAIGTWFQAVETKRPRARTAVTAGMLALTFVMSVLLFVNPSDQGLLTAFPDIANSLGVSTHMGRR